MISIDLINEILHWVCLYILLWYAYILIVNKGTPNITTAPAIRKKIIEILKQDADQKGKTPYTIIDMGCGNGAFVRQIAKNIPNSHVIGLEIDPVAYGKAIAGKKVSGLENIEYVKGSFYDYDLSGADAITLFHLGSSMPELREKISKELPQGALIAANRFPLGGDFEPTQSLDVKTFAPNQKELYIYKV